MKRLLTTAVLTLAVLAGTQGQVQAQHGGGCGFGIGIGFSFSCYKPRCAPPPPPCAPQVINIFMPPPPQPCVMPSYSMPLCPLGGMSPYGF